MKSIIIFLSFVLISFSQNKNQTKPILTEEDKIKYLLNELEKNEGKLKFVRNGEEFSAKEAKAHMQKKLDYAGKEIKSVRDFIDKIATKSYLTGNKYYVKFPDGKKEESAVWLRELLKKVE